MAINFYGVSPANGFFNIAGKLFKVQKDINIARGTTIPADILALINSYNLQTLTTALNSILTPVPGVNTAYAAGANSPVSTLQAVLSAFLISVVNTDAPQADSSLTTALKQFIAQMQTQAITLNKSAIAVSAAAGSGNYGDGVCVTTALGGAGLVQENSIGETINGTTGGNGTTAGFQFLGGIAASSPLGQDWPAGSGCNKTLTGIDANQTAGSLLTNGGFETFVNQANVPDNWICSVGTPGTNLIATTIEVQTITRSGTPTGGVWQVVWQNAAGKVQYSVPIAYNATGATVQAAIRGIAGLGSITVVETGTAPNYVDTVTFAGAGGNVAQFTIIDNTTGGTHAITPATLTPGTPQVFAGGQALEFVGDGATATAINQLVSNLSPLTAYAVSLWAICDSVPGAGVVKIDLIDGIGGSVINDAQGVANTIMFNAGSLTTAWQHLKSLQAAECIFRLPAQVPPVVYLRIRLSTAITNGKNMWVDNAALSAVNEFYTGGPGAVIFAGSKPFAPADSFAVTVTNDRAGVVREYMQRNLDLAGKELLLPTAASPTVPDSVAS